ncbi:MAG TPA: hypothetical protein VFP44_02860 [Usitatibacter sp.]|nr:hypothetical protein [Usitatibacter sp.]
MTLRSRLTAFAAALSALAALGAAGTTLAQGFAALVSPPRFELAAQPGKRLRDVIEITNASGQASKFRLKTADWTLGTDGAVRFDDALKPGSCRPWVAIERRDLTISPGGKYRYRFEVEPPADAPPGECRFAILVEGDETSVPMPGGPSLPISGRLGVIVYVAVGNAGPQLDVVGGKVASVNQQQLPVIMVKNSGNAHGRVTGFLGGTDAAGRKLEFTPSTLPILPGETRAIPLTLYQEREEAVAIAYPITIRGKLEWGENKSTPFEQSFVR